MTRDNSVGAVCARTHPLGSGLLVWYQVFEYAIGHWFLKPSEHVLGSVLCAPGCFSVYRCKALKDIVHLYATDVGKAEEFLTKDMGEDRWLCTLLVQKGWRIEYCATASNSTCCPESFDELFKQRHRWIVSTLANQWLLIKKWRKVKQCILRVSFFFKIYQIALLISTLIGPSSVMLVVTGGLQYGKDWDPSVTLSLQVVASICYGFVCLYTSKQTQLTVAKVYSCLYTLLMTIAIVGTIVEIASDINGEPGAEDSFISKDIKISTTSVYVIGMAGLYFVTAALHLVEFWTIFYGFIYLLGLPSGYLVLMIYSICNITDRSWGTRDDSQSTGPLLDNSWLGYFRSVFKVICPCCTGKNNEDKSQEVQYENQATDNNLPNSLGTNIADNIDHLEAPAKLKDALDEIENLDPKDMTGDEKTFWENVVKEYLTKSSESDAPLKEELQKLRNKWLLIFFMINLQWLILISSLADKGKILGVLGSNPVGFAVVVVYGAVLVIQFLVMIVHRISTFMHYMAIVPYKCNSNYNSSWLFPNSQEEVSQGRLTDFVKNLWKCNYNFNCCDNCECLKSKDEESQRGTDTETERLISSSCNNSRQYVM